jgi:hypothetical protein
LANGWIVHRISGEFFNLNSIASFVCLSCTNTELCVLSVVSVDFRENDGNEVFVVFDLLQSYRNLFILFRLGFFELVLLFTVTSFDIMDSL